MGYLFSIILINIFVALLFCGISLHNSKVYKNSINEQIFIVRLPYAYPMVFLVFLIFVIVFFVYCTFIEYQEYVNLVFAILGIIGFCLFLGSLLFKITVDKKSDSFVYRSSFGRTHIFYYNHIDNIIIKKNTLIVKIDGKTLYIDKNSENYALFYRIVKKYRR